MSSNATTTTDSTTTPIKEETTTSKKKEPEGFLGTGLDFNNPLHFGAALLVIAPVGYIGFNFLKNYLTKQFPQLLSPQPQQPPVVNTTQPKQQQPPQRKRPVEDRRKKTAEEEYYENLRLGRIVEDNNNHLRNYNIHRNDYSHQQPSFTAASMLAAEELVDIVDDNQIAAEYKKQPRQELIIPEEQETEFQRRYSKPTPKQEQQQRQPLEDSLLIPSDEIDIYSNDEINPDEIPKEFVNVGNVPKAFENIQMIEEEEESNGNEEDDIYDIENMELDSETLKKMELNALKSNDDYYK